MTLMKEEEVFVKYEAIARLAQSAVIYGSCPGCNHKFCVNCEYCYECDDASRLLPEGFNISLFPPEMRDKTIQCCTCLSEQHLIDWLRRKYHPVLYLHAKEGIIELNFMLKYELLEQINK
jgi:hypothetical protein